jgi:uncharacterized protein YbjQ (UPF0145 family)
MAAIATFQGCTASNRITNNLLKDRKSMLVTTTPIIEGKRIVKYYGIVSGETIIGANVFRDIFASIRDIVGGRSGAYEEVLRMAKDTALQEMQAQAAQMGANAVIGVDLDYETVGGSGSMLMVTANGTAVTIED